MSDSQSAAERARYVRDQLPAAGLFAGLTWRISPEAFPLSAEIVARLEALGPQLLAFYRACNVMYRHSVEGKLPAWIAQYLDAGKPKELIEFSRLNRFKAHVPRVIRPDVILTNDHFFIAELDSIPGGIGLTGWLGKTYAELGDQIVGGAHGMMEGFSAILHAESKTDDPLAIIAVSDEAATYRPEMEWLGRQLGFRIVRPEELTSLDKAAIVYRFFELFDLPNIANARALMDAAAQGNVHVTPPFKPQLEEKMLFAFLWMEQLHAFWREQLGDKTLAALREVFPYTWIVDPTPLPPHAVIPELGIHDWREMARFSQKQRELVLKISGFSDRAWGSRGVYVGHDLPADEWAEAIELALKDFAAHPFILQRFEKSKLFEAQYVDFEANELRQFSARTRLCPYYFVTGDDAKLGGILATVCPADKKILHGMPDAVMAPCRVA
ncbi:MAG TPA: hypothetical protein VMV72_10845 [Verrucomicrobiae bacterium]|nr:hypothetical protein [Verrucomicrobiae bacterium]